MSENSEKITIGIRIGESNKRTPKSRTLSYIDVTSDMKRAAVELV